MTGGRRLRFSERRRLSETGSLGDLSAETVPESLRGALGHFLMQEKTGGVSGQFDRDFNILLARHFGHTQAGTILSNGNVEEILDLVEMVAELAPNRYFIGRTSYVAIANGEAILNQLFDRHRFGYELRDGEAHPVSSPALAVEVVGPALLAIRRVGWEQVEHSYREALLHLRNEAETPDALTAASAAVESALKAIGMKGQTLSALAKSFSRSGLVPGHSQALLPLLVGLVERLEAWRSSEGDAHGKPPGAVIPPRALAAAGGTLGRSLPSLRCGHAAACG